MFRQGDVLLEKVEEAGLDLNRVELKDQRIVLAEGEVTNHAHAIVDDRAELLEEPKTRQRFLRVIPGGKKEVELRHEEHAPVKIPPGLFRVVRQREYAPEAIRPVAD